MMNSMTTRPILRFDRRHCEYVLQRTRETLLRLHYKYTCAKYTETNAYF